MIRYTGKTQGLLGLEKLVGLGISRNDIDRLLRGERLVFRLEDHDMGTGQCVLFFGENELAMTQALEKTLNPSTKVQLTSGAVKLS